MSPRRRDGIVEGGRERHRIEVEREVREELLRRRRAELEDSGVLEALLARTKIVLEARAVARRLSGRDWYLLAA